MTVGDKIYWHMPDCELTRASPKRTSSLPAKWQSALCRYLFGTASTTELEQGADQYRTERDKDLELKIRKDEFVTLKGELIASRSREKSLNTELKQTNRSLAKANNLAYVYSDFQDSIERRLKGSRFGFKRDIGLKLKRIRWDVDQISDT